MLPASESILYNKDHDKQHNTIQGPTQPWQDPLAWATSLDEFV